MTNIIVIFITAKMSYFTLAAGVHREFHFNQTQPLLVAKRLPSPSDCYVNKNEDMYMMV